MDWFGAVIFRFVAVAMAATLLRWRVAKLLGGLYLMYVAIKHLLQSKKHSPDSDADGGGG